MTLTDQALAMARQFSVPGAVLWAQPYGSGHINDTFLAETESRFRFIVQRLSPAAFSAPLPVMENAARVIAHLRRQVEREGGDPAREVLTLIPARNGRAFCLDGEGALWRAFLLIENACTHDLPETPAVFREAGRAFGCFQRRLASFPAGTLAETIPRFHHTPRRLSDLRASADRCDAERLRQARGELACALSWGKNASVLTDALAQGRLPLRAVHNDAKLSNVLFDRQSGSALCVIDLDTVMPGLAAYDFGDAIRYGASTAAEDEKDLDRVHFSLPMFRAYAEGYLGEAGGLLSRAELESLPLGAMLMTYECGIRFLADHLDGDVYYHTAYPGHNLVRARTQFALLREMDDARQDMLDILNDCAKETIP